MKKLNIDNGLQEFKLGSGKLYMNPQDPNLYARFLEAAERISRLQQELLNTDPDAPLTEVMCRSDRQIKQLLDRAFGGDTDFDKLLGGVNVFAPGSNGQSVLVNLFEALQPVLEEGVRRWTDGQVEKALESSKRRKAAH